MIFHTYLQLSSGNWGSPKTSERNSDITFPINISIYMKINIFTACFKHLRWKEIHPLNWSFSWQWCTCLLMLVECIMCPKNRSAFWIVYVYDVCICLQLLQLGFAEMFAVCWNFCACIMYDCSRLQFRIPYIRKEFSASWTPMVLILHWSHWYGRISLVLLPIHTTSNYQLTPWCTNRSVVWLVVRLVARYDNLAGPI